MRRFTSHDGNMLHRMHGRSLDSRQGLHSVKEPDAMRALQMHSSLVQRLDLEKVMEGHHGCVNSLAWNAKGSLLISGSDDTRVNLWDYGSRKLVHSIDTGHSANIFCTKFMPETGDDVIVSGAGDAEVRVHRVSRSSSSSVAGRASYSEQTALFRCHTRRVKKLAVENGNPHVVWSASEDGTFRQHDFREAIVCPPSDQDCRNILLDLRSGQKKSLLDPPRHCLALKTCAISPTRPHLLLIGGSDAFARIYDRRMLSPPTSSRQSAKPPACVCYLCPTHLSDYSRSGLHLTHVTFSPNGQEILLSYSGEHVYLMDANIGQQDGVVYVASDIPKRTVLTPIVNGTRGNSPVVTVGVLGRGYRRNSSWLQECRELLGEAKKALEEGRNYTYAIEASGEVVDAGGQVVGAGLRHDCLCVRAAALLKRQWKNDVHMAIRDSNDAREINSVSSLAHHNMAEALSQLGKYKEALDFAMRSHHLDPSDTRLSDHVTQLRAKINAEEAKVNKGSSNEAKLQRRASRIRSISDLLFRSEPDSEVSLDTQAIDREDSDYFDDDLEDMDMEIEMSVTEEEERDREAAGQPGSSLNLRLRHRGEAVGREKSQKDSVYTGSISPADETVGSQPLSGAEKVSEKWWQFVTAIHDGVDGPMLVIDSHKAEVAVDMRQRYVGHCNAGTDIKQASFLGERGEFVASGSDDGRWFIWQKRTGRLIKMLNGDENVVNCVQNHPFDCAIATSGIDSTIKLWTPCARVPSMVAGGEAGPDTADSLVVMAENQSQMKRHREIGLPMELLQRFRVQEGAEGAVHPFQCTQS